MHTSGGWLNNLGLSVLILVGTGNNGSVPIDGGAHGFKRPSRLLSERWAEWIPPETIHVFTTPWKRVGLTEFNLATFEETA